MENKNNYSKEVDYKNSIVFMIERFSKNERMKILKVVSSMNDVCIHEMADGSRVNLDKLDELQLKSLYHYCKYVWYSLHREFVNRAYNILN